ncbi:CsiV family protein [Marinicella sediminis]|uniref:CsiV family protein n=1 Tax=Marinicella sediminis TaxID=1792834 RepID=A0ABV7J8Q2_9GAMM|nr:CsiV family protein [Marinicella sediminis]
MRKIIPFLVLFTTALPAQEYHLITDETPVYDVEVIVFARLLGQPEASTLNPKPTSLELPYREVTAIDESWLMFQPHQTTVLQTDGSTEQRNEQNPEDWQVPMDERQQEPETEALVWVRFAENSEHPVTERLATNPGMAPLMQMKWRQPATPFLNPEFVRVSSVWEPTAQEQLITDAYGDQTNRVEPGYNVDESDLSGTTDLSTPAATTYADYAFDGAVAFSEQRFTHIQVKMNFYRQDNNGQQLTYSIDQKSRIRLGEWHYFDHQQFGILTKVIQVDIEPQENEES